MRGSGDGWVSCDQGHRHWGRFGAAGLLLRRSAGSDADVLLQLRVEWSHHGGTWGLPGGARDADEPPIAAALREAAEETSVDPRAVHVEASLRDDHGGWSYTTIIGSATSTSTQTPEPVGPESTALRWVAEAEVEACALHPGFARTWPLLRRVGPAPVLLVDAANVVGSRPDGWWRDRAGAATRLRDALAAARPSGLRLGRFAGLPESSGEDWRSYPRIVLVVEGAARRVPSADGVDVVSAAASGDDALVATATASGGTGRPVVAVTADRELRTRLERTGASVLGPRALWSLLEPTIGSSSATVTNQSQRPPSAADPTRRPSGLEST